MIEEDNEDPLAVPRGIFNALPLALLVWLVPTLIVVLLSGCSTFTGYTPPVLINGYDPTLSSHAEALGLKEPRHAY